MPKKPALAADEVYTLKEAAAILKINERTLQRLVKEGKVPAFRLGKVWRFYRKDLLNLRLNVGEHDA